MENRLNLARPSWLRALTPENIVPEDTISMSAQLTMLGPLRSAPQRISVATASNEFDSFEDRTGSQGEFSARSVLYANATLSGQLISG